MQVSWACAEWGKSEVFEVSEKRNILQESEMKSRKLYNVEKTEIFWNQTSYTKHMLIHRKKDVRKFPLLNLNKLSVIYC